MRLNKTMRMAFVREVMQDVPKVDYDGKIQAAITAAAVASLPPKLAAVYKDPELRGFLKTDRLWLGNGQQFYHVMGVGPWKDKLAEVLDPLLKASAAQRETRNALERKLHAAIEGCTTTKQAREMMPEFAKYLPAEGTTGVDRTVPAIANLLADFVAAGWPKGRKPPAPLPKRNNLPPAVIQAAGPETKQ